MYIHIPKDGSALERRERGILQSYREKKVYARYNFGAGHFISSAGGEGGGRGVSDEEEGEIIEPFASKRFISRYKLRSPSLGGEAGAGMNIKMLHCHHQDALYCIHRRGPR